MEITSGRSANFVCAVRPNLDHNVTHLNPSVARNAYMINQLSGMINDDNMVFKKMYFNGRPWQFTKGDRIGTLLDLGASSIRFFRNGVQCGSDFTENVT